MLYYIVQHYILSTGRYNAMYLQNEMQALFNLLFIYI